MTDGAQPWHKARTPFAILAAPPMLWLLVFFLAPLAIIWAYSFGENTSLTDISINGTFANYARAMKPLYLAIIAKSLWFAALTTLACLIIGFPVAVAITFADARTKVWLLLLVMLPFWTNLLIRTYALMAVLRTEGTINTAVGWLGLGPFDLLHNNFAVVFGLVYVQLPFMVLPLYAEIGRAHV